MPNRAIPVPRSALRLLSIEVDEPALASAMTADARLAAGSLAAARIGQIDGRLLERLQPDLVLAPLLGEGFDILDVAQALTAAGYAGRLLAICPKLPNPRGVQAELRGHCKGFSVELLQLG
ncbi:MAG: hypothetical protein ACOY5U_09370 [Pseudomonadota bacterium]